MNHEEIKRYFENNPPPKEVRLTEWANITDTQVFLNSCYSTIRNFNGPVDRMPGMVASEGFLHSNEENSRPAGQRGTCFRIILILP
ncbi:DUF6965 family protein [Flavobacterium anhuiense]|uniref:DUF6965 family protein n=1 Tax=Flavobacterium anhuiense TaxID=459526 RepID=UPI003D97BF60